MGRDLSPKELADFQKERENEFEREAEKLGATVAKIKQDHEKIAALYEKHRVELITDEWEKELVEKNKRKAGIL